MVTFFVCLVLLIVGFFTYSKLVEKIFRIDDRPTPAVAHPDGVDYVPMKTWRIFLVQLLNIAGLGPIYGALSGACWGPVIAQQGAARRLPQHLGQIHPLGAQAGALARRQNHRLDSILHGIQPRFSQAFLSFI